MDTARRTGEAVASAIVDAGVPHDVIARAADITPSDLESRLSGQSDFSVAELVNVGGSLRISAALFFPREAAS